jgi:hypothetical protein
MPKPSKDERLFAAIEALQKQVEELQKQVAANSERHAPEPDRAIHLPKFPMWSIIRNYLRANGMKASARDIAEGLIKEGHDLGKYPLRNVKITVSSPLLRDLFKISTDATGVETIHLLDVEVPFSPKTQPAKQSTIRRR